MKLVIQLGPDTISTAKYSSKMSLRKKLNILSKTKDNFKDYEPRIKFMGSFYSKIELINAEIMTQNEYFKTIER